MNKLFFQVGKMAIAIITFLFTITPEEFFCQYKLLSSFSDAFNIVLMRILTCLGIYIVCCIVDFLRKSFRNKVTIERKDQYVIEIGYGDLLEFQNGKVLIPFDECFTTNLGNNSPECINRNSICGQYLEKYPIQDIRGMINKAGLEPSQTKSRHRSRDRYESGSIVPNGRFLLMAFAKLDETGLAKMTRDEYLRCLFILWHEVEKYYGQEDVYMPILGSGVTRMEDKSLSQQELLDLIIESYQLSSHKIKLPNKLCIICRKNGEFSINRIGENKFC